MSSPLRSPSRPTIDRKSTRLNSSHTLISYAVFCLKKKKNNNDSNTKSIQTVQADTNTQPPLAPLLLLRLLCRCRGCSALLRPLLCFVFFLNEPRPPKIPPFPPPRPLPI